MQKAGRSILSDILRKQMENLGYPSLSKFYGDHREIGYSYELLRQVVYGGRIPRAETLLAILSGTGRAGIDEFAAQSGKHSHRT